MLRGSEERGREGGKGRVIRERGGGKEKKQYGGRREGRRERVVGTWWYG